MGATDSTFVCQQDQGALLRVKLHAGARRTAIEGLLGDHVKISVSAPPEQGRANRACLKLLAQVLGVALSSLSVIAGHTSQRKLIRVSSLSAEQVIERITSPPRRGSGSE
jgi:uncharacterized protein (TIGR00251 family)